MAGFGWLSRLIIQATPRIRFPNCFFTSGWKLSALPFCAEFPALSGGLFPGLKRTGRRIAIQYHPTSCRAAQAIMRMRNITFILLALLAGIGGAQLRIAKIVIQEPGGPRTVFCVCRPGRQPDVFDLTDRDFMCRIFDRYGLREVEGGFGVATQARAPRGPDAISSSPDERDRQVLECLLLHLLTDQSLKLTQAPGNGASIVLHTQTPEGTAFLRWNQIRSDSGSRPLPSGTLRDLRRRNVPAEAKPEAYDAVVASYSNLTFAAGIVVADLTELRKRRPSYHAFEDTYPKARGWLMAYLPGFSKDGSWALVRADIGPSSHGAMLTAVLARREARWIVQWYHIAYYA